MVDGDFKRGEYEPYTENEEIALRMAQELHQFCNKHRFPPSSIFGGVAWNGQWVYQQAFNSGVKTERNRISKLLGLTDG